MGSTDPLLVIPRSYQARLTRAPLTKTPSFHCLTLQTRKRRLCQFGTFWTLFITSKAVESPLKMFLWVPPYSTFRLLRRPSNLLCRAPNKSLLRKISLAIQAKTGTLLVQLTHTLAITCRHRPSDAESSSQPAYVDGHINAQGLFASRTFWDNPHLLHEIDQLFAGSC